MSVFQVENITALPPDLITELFNRSSIAEVVPFLENDKTKELAFKRIYNNICSYNKIPPNLQNSLSQTIFTSEEFVEFLNKGLPAYPDTLFIKETLPFFERLLRIFRGEIEKIGYISCVIDTDRISEIPMIGVFKVFKNIFEMKLTPESSLKGTLRDIDGIRFPPNLRRLDLKYNMINDISGLGKLEFLEELDLSYNDLENIDMISDNIPPNLTYLNLKNNINLRMDDLHKIRIPPSLKELILDENSYLTRSFVLNLENSNLSRLSLSCCRISSLNFVKLPQSLQEIDLSSNLITDLKTYSWPDNLKKLNLKFNSLKDVPALPPNLEVFWLNYNRRTLVIDVQFPTSMRELYIGNNENSEVLTINSLPNLEKLSCKQSILPFLSTANLSNNITSLNFKGTKLAIPRNFDFPNNLISLNLADTSLRFDGFLDLTNTKLERLNMSKNGIKDISHIKFPESLKVLNLSINLISLIDNHTLPNGLTELNLYGNHISELDEFKLPKSLTKLDLGSNYLEDIEDVDFLRCEKLEYVSLRANPIKEVEDKAFPSSLKCIWI